MACRSNSRASISAKFAERHQPGGVQQPSLGGTPYRQLPSQLVTDDLEVERRIGEVDRSI
ncbi:hypothetical protein ASE03_20525 [Kitasatospora sp. Root187]|nr:hypothetical protein ASC99_06595 [Kitasatospora sp. Root107]KRB74825.1 hypothetical protein ASE03_20525 [Kitasatospora sp. Root187]